MRSSSNDAGDSLGDDAYFGLSSTRARASTVFDPGYGDYNTGMPINSAIYRFDSLAGVPDDNVEYSWIFSLDDISGTAPNGKSPYLHISGSRKNTAAALNQGSITAANASYKAILSEGVRQFWAPMYGGHDGFDITEAEPFRNSAWSSTTTNLADSAFNSVQRAIYTVEDPEAVEYSVLTAPGITNTSLTDTVMNTCATRGDALAIVDLEGVFTAETEGTDAYSSRLGSVSTTVTNIQTRDIDNSYACAYYPWAQIMDSSTSKLLSVPPSVVALGTFASSDAASELWFAPAGFNRGGLSAGSSGLHVTNVTERLTSKKRDDLYENNINPIAKFPNEGIVIFGQKTLQQTSSALDRINVRRLLIYIKKEISRIAAGVLFDQNVSVTWSRFTGQAEPFLSDIQSRFGLSDFQVVLDETTTSDDLIDRNIMYSKIFLKPARAIEYIAIDFIITNTGASFAD
jgi:phage tail sheath protein FI